MDPLSITVSVLTLTSAVAACLNRLRTFQEAPKEIHSLFDEVNDLRIVIQEADKSLRQQDLPSIYRSSAPLSSETVINLSTLLSRAKVKLVDLEEILNNKLLIGNAKSGKFKYARTAWLKNKSTVESIGKDLVGIKINIMTVMGAATSTEIFRIQLKLDEIMAVTGSLVSSQERVMKKEVLRTDPETSAVLRSEMLHNGAINNSHRAVEIYSVASQASTTRQSTVRSAQKDLFDLLRGQISKSNCPKWCSCICHKPGQLSTPRILGVILGALSVGYTNVPLITQPCNQKMCRPRRGLSTSITYQFPRWLLMRAVSLMVSSTNAGPELLLRTLRVLPPNAEIFRLVINGDLEGVKTMFSNGQASIHDIDDRRWSLLHKSYLVGQEEVVRFLLDQGADVNLEAENGSSVVERAWVTDRIRVGNLSLAHDHILRHIDIQDLTETQQYSTLHKIVLGISKLDLESQLEESTVDIDTPDTRGRTALWWASIRGDETAVRSLLEHGASLDKRSGSYHSPIHIAKSPAIVKLLLEYGEQIDCRDEFGRTTLHRCAYRADYRAGSKDLLDTLLDYGADVQARARAGNTALHYASMYGFVDGITTLLNRGAFIEAQKQDGHTPLMEAIRCSQPRAVNLLLQKGADHTAVSGTGKTILHICASCGNISTLNALTAARLSGIDVDAMDGNSLKARDHLKQRKDITEDLETAFEELIESIHQEIIEDTDIGSDHYEDALEE